MKIAVVGGTGRAGRHVVEALRRAGHDPIVVSRSMGVDVTTGDGLVATLARADAAIDVINIRAATADEARAAYGAAARQLLAAEEQSDVAHHVLLSIVGIDRVEGHVHYAGKLVQEEVALTGPIPASVVRATQFHDFAGMVVDSTRRGDTATVPPLLVQPVDLTDVAQVLVEVATGEPLRGTIELAGPETQDLVDMARRTLAARGEELRLVPRWGGAFGVQMAGDVLLPGPAARLGKVTFDEWLARSAGGPKVS